MLRVLFRADGGPAIGDGHLMRCLALAQYILDRGGVSYLVTADLAARPIGDWQREKIAIDALRYSPGGDADAQATVVAAEKMQANFVVVDGYCFAAAYHNYLSQQRIPTLRFDDTCEQGLQTDIVVNQNPGAEERCHGMDAGHALLGCDYVMLRRSLRSSKVKADQEIPHVLITLGGYDPDSLALAIATTIFHRTVALTATLVCAGGAREFMEAEEWSRQYAGKVDVITPGDIDDQMTQANLAICAGGTTSLELASLGVPMVILIRADNQRSGAHTLEEKGCALVAGEGREAVAAAAQKTVALLGDPQRRARMGHCGRRLVDGHGVERVTDTMLECIQQGQSSSR